MTLEECASLYDVSIYFDVDKEVPEETGWRWDINGGYSSVGGRFPHLTPNQALEELEEFLKTFTEFEK